VNGKERAVRSNTIEIAKRLTQSNLASARSGAMIAAVAVLAGGIGGVAKSANSADVGHDKHHVEMLYSEDDALCKPLASLYDRLEHEDPQELDWEDRYANQFRSIGLEQPKPLNDTLHPLGKEFYRKAYYRLSFPSEMLTRLVYLEDTHWLGRNRVFKTNVWIFKNSADVESEDFFSHTLGGGPGEGFAPDKIDIALLFAGAPSTPEGFRRIELPYYFKKIASPAELSSLQSEKLPKLPGLQGWYAHTVQRLFNFNKKLYIIANNQHSILIYQLKDHKINDVCYMATSESLQMTGWKPLDR
jgi:hypothetical protein